MLQTGFFKKKFKTRLRYSTTDLSKIENQEIYCKNSSAPSKVFYIHKQDAAQHVQRLSGDTTYDNLFLLFSMFHKIFVP